MHRAHESFQLFYFEMCEKTRGRFSTIAHIYQRQPKENKLKNRSWSGEMNFCGVYLCKSCNCQVKFAWKKILSTPTCADRNG